MLNPKSILSANRGRIGKLLSAGADRQMSNAAASVYAIRLGGAGFGYVVQVVLAQFLGALNYGVFAMMWILTTVLAQLAAVGFNESSSRFLPGYLACGDQAHARGFVHLSKRLTFGVSLAVMFVGICVLFLGRSWIAPIYFWPTVLALLCIPFATWTHLMESIAISRSWMIRGLMPTYVLRPAFLILGVTVGITVFSLPGTAATAAGALLVSCFIVAILQGGLLRNLLSRELGSGKPRYKSRLWITSSALLIMSQGFVILATNVDVLMLGLLTSPDDVGVYFAAAKSVAVVSFISIAVGNAMARRLAEANATGEAEAFAKHFMRARTWMLWPSMVLGIVVTVSAPVFMRIFGPEFTGGSIYVAILMGGVYIQAAAGPLQEALVVLGKQRELALVTFLSLFMNVVLNLVLVLWIGVVGAAIASVAATGFRILYLRRLIPAEMISAEAFARKQNETT